MQQDRVGYTVVFRGLADFDSEDLNNDTGIRDIFMQREKFDQNDAQHGIKTKKVNPGYILPDYLAEIAIKKMGQEKD